MSITIYRDLNRGMAELFLHIDERFLLLKEQRGEAVPEVMKPHLREPGLLKQAMKNTMAEVVGIQEPTEFITKDPVGQFFPLACDFFKFQHTNL